MAHATHRRSDFGAALTGLVVGGCLLFALVYGIVAMTHARYAGEGKAAAEATH